MIATSFDKDTLFRNILLSAIIVFINYSCGNQTTATGNTGYFNLQKFFSSEVKRLNNDLPLIEKVAFLNGETEIQQFSQIDWDKELELFTEANIDKKSFIGKYKVDTIELDQGVQCIQYIASDTKLTTQRLKLYFTQSSQIPFGMDADIIVHNFFYKSTRSISYNSGSKGTLAYNIKGMQDILLLGKDTFAIKTFAITD